ncbi:hypothetical protein LCGC14_2264400 [marine sediment metagenome]|uniref:Uncharacterized protein n=1 Tax=marine sediment metagenome TaxID=412755 RepID=A0A0F9C1J5_9ZZZZ
MTIGNGIAVAGIWLGVGLVGFSGAATGIPMVAVAVAAAFATLFISP